MYRISIHTRAHDFAKLIASLVGIILIGVGLIVASIAADTTDQDLSQRIESPHGPLHPVSSPGRD